ncbi:hypothetical protein [Arenicella sp. 4NH20-0111]|uniref:hypothetical protein n=1 Tax=Arenicella sp. 4NH20-0111 TaxID=3127648 RepID=UPI0033407EEB
MKLKYIMMSSLLLSSVAIVGSSVADDEAATDLRSEKRELKRQYRDDMRELRSESKAKRMLVKVDTNKDGQVDLNEYLAHAQERFNKLDIDDNGFINQEEAKESMKRMRKEHKERRKEMRAKRQETEG